MNKRNSGITLVALVITIIVLLILAGITIGLVVGDNGIFKNAIGAKEKHQQAERDEEGMLGDAENIINSYVTGDGNGSGNGNGSSGSEITINLGISGTKLKDNTTALAGLPTVTTGVQATAKSVYTDGSGDKAIIPAGFTVSNKSGENTVSSGLVVSDSNGNEFVWIPVDQNQVIDLSVTSEEDMTSIVLYNPYGDKIVNLTDQGKSYSTTINTYGNANCVNGGYTAVVTTANNEKKQSLSVRSLYAQDTFNDYFTSNEYAVAKGYSNLDAMKTDYLSENGIYHYHGYASEADFVSRKSGEGSSLSEILANSNCSNIYEYFGYENYEDYQEKAVETFGYASKASMKDLIELKETDANGTRIMYSKSVNDNGGFYMGRYEAGNSNGTAVCKMDQEPYGKINYNNALTKASEINNMCTLPTGAAWDRTLGFLMEAGTNNKTMSQITFDSHEWGNNLNSEFSVTNSNAKYTTDSYHQSAYVSLTTPYSKVANTCITFTTGVTSRNTAKNIYDLAGNVFEWTSEKIHGVGRQGVEGDYPINRGGDSGYVGTVHPVYIRHDYGFSNVYNGIGFRPALFIQ